MSCSQKQQVDLILHNANIYTVDDEFSVKEAIAIKENKIVALGTDSEIRNTYQAKQEIDLEKKYVYPGFIDPHCHFYGYGMNLLWADLTKTKSFDDVIERIKEHHKKTNSNWILGRGWDQNDWEVKEFPNKDKLDELFPDTPVYLVRIDGHAALINSKAIEISGFDINTKFDGGHLEIQNNELTGILIDKAKDEFYKFIPSETKKEKAESLIRAAENCFEVGLTSVADAGLEKETIEVIDSIQKSGELKMRIYAMIESSDKKSLDLVHDGIYKTDFLNVRSIKVYADGALGSRGALMIDDYADDPGNKGLLINSQEYYDSICELALKYNFQVCTHAIGDGANRIVLNTYAKYLQGKNDKRWRIEHAQVIHPEDFSLYGDFNIVPCVQSTHATSDMYWAEDRLGKDRIKNAYALKELLQQNGWIPNGSDFPIESINPLYGYYAAVARKDLESYPENGFQMENALTREEALRAMTIWAAKSCFEEYEKGSLENGKFADFVVLKEDLLNIDENKIPTVKVLQTFADGKLVYARN